MNIVHAYIETMKNWTPEEIREFRKRLNLYQKNFAQMIGVTERYIIYLEQGVRQPSKTMKILLSMMETQENEKGKEENKHGKKRIP
jgi:DNA-binding transcriptional regulator YiaG